MGISALAGAVFDLSDKGLVTADKIGEAFGLTDSEVDILLGIEN